MGQKKSPTLLLFAANMGPATQTVFAVRTGTQAVRSHSPARATGTLRARCPRRQQVGRPTSQFGAQRPGGEIQHHTSGCFDDLDFSAAVVHLLGSKFGLKRPTKSGSAGCAFFQGCLQTWLTNPSFHPTNIHKVAGGALYSSSLT